MAFSLQSTSITDFIPGCTSTISGTANGGSVNFQVTVTDNAEPGAGSDTFRIEVPAPAYIGTGTLGGGNIQVHRMRCRQHATSSLAAGDSRPRATSTGITGGVLAAGDR